jgi:tRNA(Arg) A34 adenosine deaminase TadA
MALRDAGRRLADHRIENGVVYASAEPCPLCLAACYWAGITRLVYAATVADSAEFGFEDEAFYRELARENSQRTLLDEVHVDGEHRVRAVAALADWKRRYRS